MLTVMFLGAAVFFLLAYRFYGRFMAEKFSLDDSNKTPAETMFDNMDYVPSHPALVLGHHFSSIAGAGPVVGPITAAGMFGWLPAYIWVVLGCSFIGGPHDTGSMVASIRHKAQSTGMVIKRWIGDRGSFLFLCFSILTLFLIQAVFLQLSCINMASDPAVAFTAIVFMFAAVIIGLLIYRFNVPLKWVTVIMLPVVFGSLWVGSSSETIQTMFKLPLETWRWVIVAYMFAASLLPVWLLLQPRDYMTSYFLYFVLIVGAVGMIFGSFGGGFEVTQPAFKGFSTGTAYLWPMLFVVVACGAVSGFHSMVGSGTTAKQIRKEKDTIIVGYGSMLLEGIVAVIALGTFMIATQGASPMITYANGFSRFATLLGIEPAMGMTLGLFAINSFVLTSLDTATRLTRYQLQEITGQRLNKYVATTLAVGGALFLVLSKTDKGASIADVIWPIFGSANQLVAALALLTVAVWLKKGLKVDNRWLIYPMWFMLATTIAALFLLIRNNLMAAVTNWPLVIISVVLVGLAFLMVREAMIALKSEGDPASDSTSS
jgi:carbon starvation protein